jgi:hypothetical protein
MQGRITVTSGATLNVKHNNCPTITSCQTGSTVEFSGTSSQTIAVTNYYNLTVNNSNGIDLGTRSADTVRGLLNFVSGSLTLNTSRLVLTGTVTGMNGTNCFTGNSGGTGTGPDVFILSSGAAGTIYFDQSTYNNTERIDSFLVGSGSSVMIGNHFTIRSDYVLNGSVNNNGNTIYVRGNISGAGTETGSGCDSMVSTTSSAQTIGAVTLSNLKLNDANGYAANGNLTITGALTFMNGTMDITGDSIVLAGSVNGMSSARYFSGSATSALTINSTATAGTIFLGTTTSTRTLRTFINNTGGTTTLGTPVTITGKLSLDAGTLANNGNAISLSGSIAGTGTLSGTGTTTLTGN